MFPAGTEVDAYLADGLSHGDINGAPPRSVIDSQTMGVTSLTFTGLDPRARYIAHAEVGGIHRYVWFTTGQPDFVTAGVLYSSLTPGAPDVELGDDGDFYYDKFNAEIYGPKADGAWPAGVSLMGPAGPAGEGAGHTIHDEGVAVTQRTVLNFIGAAVTAADEPGNTRTNVTIDAPTTADLEDEASARAAADTAVSDAAAGAVAAEVTARADADSALDSRVAAIEGDYVTAADLEGATMEVLTLESDATATQALTTSFVAMKQADNTTDSSVTPTSGKRYEIVVSWMCSRASGIGARVCRFEVRAGATVLAKSVPGGENGGRITLGDVSNASPHREEARCGVFMSDGTPVKFYVTVDSVTDTPALERDGSYVLLREVD